MAVGTGRKRDRPAVIRSSGDPPTTGRYDHASGGAPNNCSTGDLDVWVNETTSQIWLFIDSTTPIEITRESVHQVHQASAGPTTSDTGHPIGRRWIKTSTGQLWICTDTTAPVWTPVPRRIVRTTTQTTTSTTLQEDDTLTFPVVLGRRYSFRFGLFVQSANVNTGIALALNVPTFHEFSATSLIPESGDLAIGFHTFDFDERIGASVPAADTDYFATLEGGLRPSANGSVTLWFRSGDAGVTVRVRENSFVEYTEHFA